MFKFIPFLSLIVLSHSVMSVVVIDPNDLRDRVTQSLDVLEKRINAHKPLLSNEFDKNSIVFVGPSGAGKSTVITWLGGAPLTVDSDFAGRLVLSGQLNEDITIGADLAHGTTIPGAHYSAEHDSLLWDCPGFGDPGGPIEDITNAACITRLLRSCSQTKIALVLSSEEVLVNARASHLVRCFNQVAEIFSDTNQLHTMLSLILTKRDFSNPANPLSILQRAADIQLTQGLDFTPAARTLIQFLSDPAHIHHVLYMPKALDFGNYTASSGGLWEGLNQLPFVYPLKSHPFIPHGSLDYLITINQGLQATITHTLQSAAPEIMREVDTKVTNFTGTSDNLRAMVTTHLNLLNNFSVLPAQKEPLLNFFKSLGGLPQQDLVIIQGKLEQMDVLMATLAVSQRNIQRETGSWIAALAPVLHHLNQLSETLRMPQKTIRSALKGSFQNGTQGLVQETETFRLPNGQMKETTREVSATRKMDYVHDDPRLQSRTKERYTTIHGHSLEGDEGTASYQLTRSQGSYTSINVPARQASLSITRTYTRADGSQYNRQESLQAPMQQIQNRWNSNDNLHQSQEFASFRATYDGGQVALGEHVINTMNHTPHYAYQRKIVRKEESGNVYRVTFACHTRYTRHNNTTYDREEAPQIEEWPIRTDIRQVEMKVLKEFTELGPRETYETEDFLSRTKRRWPVHKMQEQEITEEIRKIATDPNQVEHEISREKKTRTQKVGLGRIRWEY